MIDRLADRLPCRVKCIATALVLALGFGCGFEPVGEVPFEPSAAYREWWDRTEACSGRRADFDQVRWYVIDGPGFDCPSGRCAGRWQSDGRIILAGDWLNHEMVVRHEMLHAIIGRPGHPDTFSRDCRLTWDTWQGSPAPDGPLQSIDGHGD